VKSKAKDKPSPKQ